MSERRKSSKSDQEFVSEAEDLLERMREDLADLSDQAADRGEIEPDLFNRLFRSAHTLKSLAATFQYDTISELAHRLEDLLDGVRLGRVGFVPEVVGILDEAVQHFVRQLECLGESDPADVEAIRQLVARIQSMRDAPTGEPDEVAALDIDPSLLRALTEYEEHRLRESVRRGRHVVLVNSTFEIIAFEESLSELTAAIRGVGEVISTLPAPGETPESQIHFSVLAATDLPMAEVAVRLDFPGASVATVSQGRNEVPTASPSSAAPAPAKAIAAPLEPGRDPSELASLKSISETVRVDIRKLDELMNLVGELVIQRGALGELIGQLLSDPKTARIGNAFAKVHKSLDRKVRDLQSAVLDVRMVPLRQVFEKVSRVVRRLRRDLGKDVRLEIRGADTELDKLIVESLVDPLMHIVRNALDHAIEPVEERLAAGKDAQGCIRIEAFQRGNHVVISASDDGAGIDTDALRVQAELHGLVESGETLSENDTLDLIFAPGISTRAEVTETSGRGIGMDVVRSNLTALGGLVDVASVPGRGTTISMTLPITLAIIQSLIVSVGRRRFAIPLNAVLETLLIEPSEIQRSEGRELLNLRGEAIPLRRLTAEFGLPEPTAEPRLFVIVIGVGELRLGLLVERIEGQQDTVIKPIQGPIGNIRGIAGATDLGDQDPVLVLDASSLVEDAIRRREAA